MTHARFDDHIIGGDHASRPTATAVSPGTLYACSDHTKVYQSDGSTWSDWHDGSSGGGGPATFSGAKISDPSGTAQSLSANTRALVTFDTENFDTDDYADLGSNNDRLTVSESGIYLVGGCLAVTADDGAWYDVTILTNGLGGGIAAISKAEVSANVEAQIAVSVVSSVGAGTYFSLGARTENGANVARQPYAPHLWLVRLG